MQKKIFKLLVYLLFVVKFSVSQTMQFQKYTVDDGLQNNIVFGCAQDYKGYIWLATITGIDRFDGKVFKHYKTPTLLGKATEAWQVSFITADNKNHIWAATPTSLFYYSDSLDCFINLMPVQNLIKPNQTIYGLMADDQGRIFVGLNNSFIVYNSVSKQTVITDKINFLTRSFFKDDDGSIWLGTNKGIKKTYFQNNHFIVKDTDTNQLGGTIKTVVTSITKDSKNRYWIGTVDKGLFILDYLHNKITEIKYPLTSARAHTVKDVYQDASKKETLVALDGGGLIRVNDNLEIIDINQSQEDNPKSLNNNGLYDIFVDRYKRMWISTYGNGVNVVNPNLQPFVNYVHEINNSNSLLNNMAKCVAEDNHGNLWFGTRKGISKLNVLQKKWTHINEESQNARITSDNILSITCSKQGNAWVGTYGGGLLELSTATNQVLKVFKNNADDSNSIGTDYVYTVFEDNRHLIWTGGIRGQISYLDPETNHFTRVSIQTNAVNLITQDLSGNIIIAADKGLFVIKPTVVDGKILFNNINNIYKDNKVFTLMEYEQGIYWIGTQGNGLLVIDNTGKVIKQFSSANNFPSDIINSIVKDNNGDVWISTSNGIIQYQVKTEKVYAYTKADGIAGSQYNVGSYCKTKNGSLIFGSTDGFTQFNPSDIKFVVYKPNLVFTNLSINNKPVEPSLSNGYLKTQIDELKELKLDNNQNSFTIYFANLAPSASGNHLYSWRLRGLEDEWSPFNNNTSAVYTNLSSGKYTFELRTTTKGQSEIDGTIKSITIQVFPPWYNSWWAWLIYAAIIVTAAVGVYRYYQGERTKRQFGDRLELQTHIAHEIRTPLTLIKGPVTSLVNSSKLNDDDKSNLILAQKNVAKLENMINQFIDYQKAGLNKLNMRVSKVNISSLLKDVVHSFENSISTKNLTFEFEIAEEVFSFCDVEKIEKILYNLISNAIKYTPTNGSIFISLTSDEKNVDFVIKDSGIGIPAQQQRYIFQGFFRAENAINAKEKGSGIGLSIVKEMILLHNGKIAFDSNVGVGTTFSFTIPVKDEKLLALMQENSLNESNDTTPLATTDKKHKILVVEDTEELRKFLVKELKQIGYAVFEAEQGQQALQLLKKQVVDLIITDIMMPVMNGFQFCTAVKREINTCHIPLIMLTAIHDKDYIIEGYKAGADDYVKKPFEINYIQTRIENLLQNRQMFKHKIMSVFEGGDEKIANDEEVNFLKQATEIILNHIEDDEFSVDTLATKMAMSRSVLFRKFKALSGDSPQQYINQIRLRKAVELLQQKSLSINEIAYLTGFADPKYFSTAFKKQYGKSPREYQQGLS